MDYTYKVGDKVYLKDWADIKFNTEKNRGREVMIVDIDKRDPFIPFRIETIKGYRYWTSLDAIEGYSKQLGLKI